MAIKPKTVVQLRARADCASHTRSDVMVRDVAAVIDEPTARGGTNAGPTPTETALSALIACTNVIGNKCAAKLGVDIGLLSIDVVSDFDRRGVTLAQEIDVPFPRLELTVVSNGPATQAELDAVAAEVARFCPLSKLFRQAGTEVVEVWRATGG